MRLWWRSMTGCDGTGAACGSLPCRGTGRPSCVAAASVRSRRLPPLIVTGPRWWTRRTRGAAIVGVLLVPQELGVGAGIHRCRSVSDLDDSGGQALHEVPIVRDE